MLESVAASLRTVVADGSLDAVTRTTLLRPLIWPELFRPQPKTRPSARSATLWFSPAATATTLALTGGYLLMEADYEGVRKTRFSWEKGQGGANVELISSDS